MTACCTAIRPSVSVPVLSEAMTVTEPSVSTACSRRGMARAPAIRRAPRARARVTTAGSDSGTAATTRLTAVTAMSATGRPPTTPMTKTSPESTTAAKPSTRPSAERRRCNGVAAGLVDATRAVIRPSALAAPVRTTVPVARPVVTTVPALASSPTARVTGTDSPVSADSSTLSRAASASSRSAGTTSPASTRTRSPRTRSAAGRTTSRPSRTTRAVGAASWSNAAIARSARTSCTTPMAVFTSTTSTITAVSG